MRYDAGMLKYLRLAVTALSLTACVLLVALWVRSYSREVVVGYVDSHNRGWHFVSWRGGAMFSTAEYDFSKPGAWRKYVSWEPGILGFGGFRTARSFSLRLPYWFPVLLCAGLSAAPWIKWRFSIRALLVATAVVAVGLGIIFTAT
jgi:hypothetical protein